MRLSALIAAIALAAIAACSPAPQPADPAGTTQAGAASVPSETATSGNELRMTIDGVAWHADHDVFGAWHPPGFDRALLIAGARGPKDASEQSFNLNVFGIDGPGRYVVRQGDPAGSVAQLGNYSPERFLAGSMMGYDMVVDVTVAEANPTRIEATFSGTLTGNDSALMRIEGGHFRYRE